MAIRSVAGAATLMALVLGAGSAAANAGQSAELSAQAQVTESNQGHNVAGALGADSGGIYLDDAGRAVVTVLNQEAAKQVRQAGLTPRLVKYSYTTLRQTKEALDGIRDAAQTSWGIDPSANKVVVTILDSATPAAARKVTEAAGRFGDKVAIRQQPGRNTFHIAGGDAISNGAVRCSAGFNVNRGGQNFVLTAGHCTDAGGTWSGGDLSGGQVAESDVPGADSGLITNPNGSAPGQVNDGTRITSVANPTVGQAVRKSGSTTGVTSGEVTSVDETVQFDIGVLEHMTGTTVDSAPGDSGGPGYTGSAGQGTLSGGNAVTTYFYPLSREVQMYGISLNS